MALVQNSKLQSQCSNNFKIKLKKQIQNRISKFEIVIPSNEEATSKSKFTIRDRSHNSKFEIIIATQNSESQSQ
ncbi:unnamed protein product [Rotaria socialis]|uniref:Uncharacterized protein n=1 Tax=Rotaria socialis TaxID=392032 RepID=A0A820WS12_9BILA